MVTTIKRKKKNTIYKGLHKMKKKIIRQAKLHNLLTVALTHFKIVQRKIDSEM